MSNLSGKTALITGATKGMGLAISEKLAQNGCNLCLSARDIQALNRIKQRLEKNHPAIQVNVHAGDLSHKQQVHTLCDWATGQKEPIDILINNVGIFRPVSILDESVEDYEAQMQINYYPAYYLSKTIGSRMRDNSNGHIINVSSIASRSPVASAGTYTVTKYAIRGLTQVLREELRPFGVKVTEIIPGSTRTASWEGTTIPNERFVLAEDIAQAVMTALAVSAGAGVEEIRITPTYGNI